MAHNLDINAGQASFVSARQDAWHGLGTVLPRALTAEDALTHGKLANWNTRKVPLVAEVVPGTRINVPDRFAVVRDNPVISGQIDVLGNVGNFYHCIQNEELTGLLEALVDESGAEFETAGAIDGGRKVFVTMKMPGTAKVGGVDKVDSYLAALTSHDGTMPTTLMVTPIRIVCQNTLNLAFKGADHMHKVRHRVRAGASMVQQAREALEFTFGFIDGFQEQAEQLINTTLTQSQFETIIHREFGAQGKPLATVTRTQNKLDQMAELFADAHTQKGIRDTAWAGLNALTEWHDHFSPVRANGGNDLESRSKKALFDPSFKNRALQLMMKLVSA